MTNTAFQFGTTDTNLTPIALGAMVFGTQTPEAEAHRILDHFISEVTPRFRALDGTAARGMVDTADCYSWWDVRGDYGGHSESVIGRWLADSGQRDSVFLSTKGTGLIDDIETVWDGNAVVPWSLVEPHFVGASPRVLRDSLAASLDRLGVERVDLYYNHVDDRDTPLVEAVGTFASFVSDGRIAHYGWSNVTTWRLAQIRAVAEANGWPQPAALQQEHSYLRRRAGLRHNSIVDGEQFDYLETYPDLQLVAYSPVTKGLYSDKRKRTADYPFMGAYKGPDSDARLAVVDRVAAATGATGNQVVLAWMMAKSAPRVLPLIGPRTWEQYTECVEALDLTLTADQFAELEGAGV